MSKEPESKFKQFMHATKEQAEHASSEISDSEANQPFRHRASAGKRSNADFEQVTAYIRKSTHRAAKIALLQEGKKRQFSELVEDLLSEWVEKNG